MLILSAQSIATSLQSQTVSRSYDCHRYDSSYRQPESTIDSLLWRRAGARLTWARGSENAMPCCFMALSTSTTDCRVLQWTRNV